MPPAGRFLWLENLLYVREHVYLMSRCIFEAVERHTQSTTNTQTDTRGFEAPAGRRLIQHAVASGHIALVRAGRSPRLSSRAVSKIQPLSGRGTRRIALRSASVGGEAGAAWVATVRGTYGTQRPRLVRVPSAYGTWGPGGKPPCASSTYPTREAGTRSPYVPYGGAGACASA